jgi:hypothetical protein
MRALAAFALALGGVGCASMEDGPRHSPESLRYRCIQKAHQTVRGSGVGDAAYEKMVHEVYLRCLDSHGATDAAPASGS